MKCFRNNCHGKILGRPKGKETERTRVNVLRGMGGENGKVEEKGGVIKFLGLKALSRP